jgi:N-acetylmuramoyl-L-alanine amidase
MLPPELPLNSKRDKVALSAASRRRRRRLRRQAILAGCTLIGVVLLSRIAQEIFTVPLPPMPLAYHFIPSPNFDSRPDETEISCVVLHSTVVPTTEGTVRIFLDPKREVSAHFVVGKDGQIIQMVPIEKRAWHAGESVLEGRPRVNEFSVGIEMVNLNDGNDPYTDAQMNAVAGIVRFLRSRYDIPDSRIVSHEQIALPAGRKSDPAGFDFSRLYALCREYESRIP